MTYSSRRIFKTQITGAATLKELLQTMFVAELLQAEKAVWVVSPWVGNINLIDNRSGNFDSLNPEWGHREIKFSEVLSSLMSRGSSVVLVTRNLDTNRAMVTALREEAERLALTELLTVRLREQLHSKGILLSRSMVVGSMNVTYSGIEINDESIEFVIDPEDIARTRLEYGSYLEEAT